MVKTYRVIAGAIATLVALQAAFIALGVFGLFTAVSDQGLVLSAASEREDVTFTGSVGFMLHAFGAMAIVLLSVILMVLSVFVRREAPQWAATVLGLAVLQYALGVFAEEMPQLGALHGLNAFALFVVAVMAAQKAGGPADDIELRDRAAATSESGSHPIDRQ